MCLLSIRHHRKDPHHYQANLPTETPTTPRFGPTVKRVYTQTMTKKSTPATRTPHVNVRFDGKPLAPVNTPRTPNEVTAKSAGTGAGIVWLTVTNETDDTTTPVCLLVREAVDLVASLTAAIENARA